MNLRKLIRSFGFALSGLFAVLRSEQNMRIHCLAAFAVVTAGTMLSLAAWEWVAILFCIGLVISAECMNTALERLADRVTMDPHPLIKQAKDSGSAAVLVLALIAALVGLIIFAPKILGKMGW